MELPLTIEDGHPIVVLISPPKLTDGWILEQRDVSERLYASKKRYAVITYSGFVEELAGARERKLLTDWVNEPRQAMIQREMCVGSAVHLESALQRAFVTALFWMWKPVVPTTTFGTLDESIDWCHKKLVEAGVQTPPLGMLRRRIVTPIEALHAKIGTKRVSAR